MANKTLPTPLYIDVEQICIGIFVHLDILWVEHALPLSNFKLKNQAHIDAIKRLGLYKIRVDPSRSSCRPLPPLPTVVAAAQFSDDDSAVITEKKDRLSQLIKIRMAADLCEKKMLKAASTLKNINRESHSLPRKASEDADDLVQTVIESSLIDKNVAIHMMTNKATDKDAYTHALNVMVLSMMMGKELNLSEIEMKNLGMGCIFHDIGKDDILSRVVRKMDYLTKAEESFMRQHGHYGKLIGKKLGLSPESLDIIVQHHENFDGSGYPSKLKGSQISILSRIVSLVNTYDNHCNGNNPEYSLSPSKALSYMYAHQREALDASLLSVLIRCLGIYPPGTIVELSNKMAGLVISVNSTQPLRPRVLIYDADSPKEETIIVDLLNDLDIDVVSSINAEQLPQNISDYLLPRQLMTYIFQDMSNTKAALQCNTLPNITIEVEKTSQETENISIAIIELAKPTQETRNIQDEIIEVANTK
jgi:putative nucleotidyltransferase with HDIG domain